MNKFYSQETALTYDDVNLVPIKSDIKSRLDVDTATWLAKGLRTLIPIITAPMDTVTGEEMARAVSSIGAFGIIHRYQPLQNRFVWETASKNPFYGVALGLEDSIQSIVEQLAKPGYVAPAIFCLDVAHAHSDRALDYVRTYKASKIKLPLCVGNIATKEAAIDLAKAGADILKVGIGNGSICSTRLITGFGIPSITAIMEVKKAIESLYSAVTIIADGGIRTSGDIAKALAAGADAVMIGSLAAGTDEAPGEIITQADGSKLKVYRGMASKEAQFEWKPLKSGTSPEGISTTIPYKGSIKPIIEILAGGLRSAFTYANAKNIREFQQNTQFVRVTSAGLAEAQTHILNRK